MWRHEPCPLEEKVDETLSSKLHYFRFSHKKNDKGNETTSQPSWIIEKNEENNKNIKITKNNCKNRKMTKIIERTLKTHKRLRWPKAWRHEPCSPENVDEKQQFWFQALNFPTPTSNTQEMIKGNNKKDNIIHYKHMNTIMSNHNEHKKQWRGARLWGATKTSCSSEKYAEKKDGNNVHANSSPNLPTFNPILFT